MYNINAPPDMNKHKVLYVDIDGKRGGSVHSLQVLAANLDRTRYTPVFLFGREQITGKWINDRVICASIHGLNNYDFCLPRSDIRWIYHLITWLLWLPYDILRFTAVLRKLKPELVHINVGQAITFGLACAIMRQPTVWHIREMVSLNWLGRIQARIYRTASRKVISISRAVKERLDILGCPSQVVYNSVERTVPVTPETRTEFRARHKIPENAFLVTLLANLQVNKGYLFLADVAELLADSPDICFLLTGEQQDSNKGPVHGFLRFIYRLATSRRTDAQRIMQRWSVTAKAGRAFFPGYVKASEAIAASDLIACPTIVPEPFGRTVIEAFAQAKPVIASAKPAFDETIRHAETGLLITMVPQIWANEIKRLHDDRASCARLGRNGLAESSLRFSAEYHAKDVMVIYEDILQGGKE